MSQFPNSTGEPECDPRRQVRLRTSKSLLARLLRREPEAWRECVSLYSPLLVRWCRRQGLAEPDVDDVTQNVFLAVSQSLDSFHKESSRDSFRGWLARITHRRIADLRQRQGRQTQPRGGSEALEQLQQYPELVESEAEVEEETRYLYHRAVEIVRSEFSDQAWQVFWLLTVEGRTASEAAGETGATAAAVRQIKSRIVRRIKQVLGDLPD